MLVLFAIVGRRVYSRLCTYRRLLRRYEEGSGIGKNDRGLALGHEGFNAALDPGLAAFDLGGGGT